MLKWGFTGDVVCTFCGGGNEFEDRNNLFFACPFSKRIWREVMGACLVSDVKTDWEDLMAWGWVG
jgi:hypothetical protein